MDPVAFQVGAFSIRWYGILMSCAIGAGLFAAYGASKRQGVDSDSLLDIAIIAIPAAIIGARLYYVIFSGRLGFYMEHPWEILATWHGGLAIHGGLIGGICAGYFYVRKHHLSFWKMADILAPGIALGQAIGRWGNFFNQEAHGGPVTYDFISKFPGFIQQGMFIEGRYYHPTFLYESLWDFSLFLFLAFLFRRKNIKTIKTGNIFLSYLAIYSLGRFFIEGLRTDSLMLGPLRMAQVVSSVVIVVSVFLIIKNRKKTAGES